MNSIHEDIDGKADLAFALTQISDLGKRLITESSVFADDLLTLANTKDQLVVAQNDIARAEEDVEKIKEALEALDQSRNNYQNDMNNIQNEFEDLMRDLQEEYEQISVEQKKEKMQQIFDLFEGKDRYLI